MTAFPWLLSALAIAEMALYFCGCGTPPTRRPTPEMKRTTLEPTAYTTVWTQAAKTTTARIMKATTTPLSTREPGNCAFGDMACRMASLDLDDRCLYWKTGECEKLPGQTCSCIPPTTTTLNIAVPTTSTDSAVITTTTTATITKTTTTARATRNTVRIPVFSPPDP
ncbi:hypothetical protein FOL47_003520 [Perkinsus chesapeaki]|uniref:Uncharacterized protein n=1 Tax=Perkinsus chesapeaki TaxID=330153 RepID=A0A7J6MZK6_PERCH|nr:hypothetical protein FOL47_003520 [Perkinsus chesapeaki]